MRLAYTTVGLLILKQNQIAGLVRWRLRPEIVLITCISILQREDFMRVLVHPKGEVDITLTK